MQSYQSEVKALVSVDPDDQLSRREQKLVNFAQMFASSHGLPRITPKVVAEAIKRVRSETMPADDESLIALLSGVLLTYQ